MAMSGDISDHRALQAAVASLTITLPDWVAEVALRYRSESDPVSQMRMVIALAAENIDRELGGPFGAAVFEEDSGRLIGAGVNLVTSHSNSALHAEVVALMLAEAKLGSYSLAGGSDGSRYRLVTSCEPCAMCLGAVHWSGVGRVISAATREDALALGFDEGPVFKESYQYLEDRGVKLERSVLREEATAVLRRYRDLGGAIYNA